MEFLIPGSFSATQLPAEEQGGVAAHRSQQHNPCLVRAVGRICRARGRGGHLEHISVSVEPVSKLVKKSGLVNLVLLCKVPLSWWHLQPRQICCEYQ